MSVYGSISYFGKKLDEVVEIVSSSNPLELNLKKQRHKKLSKLSADEC